MPGSIVYKKIVMFGDLNPVRRLYGGTMMSWVDEAASIFAVEKLGPDRHFVTLKISEALFEHPAQLGDLLTFRAQMIRTGRTSFGISVSVRNRSREIVSCDVTFVTVDEQGHPIPHGLTL